MELRWLQSFVAVAEELHFSRAARRLHLAQPALTAQIKQLESTVGAPLFTRTNRMGGLTPAGVALLPEARAILARTSTLKQTVGRAADGQAGELRLGIIPPAALDFVAESVREFTLRFPGLDVSVRQDSQARLVAALQEGELDLVLGRDPSGALPRASLGHRRLLAEEQGILLRADHPLAAGPTVALAKLEGATLLLLRGNAYFGGNLRRFAASRGITLKLTPTAEDFPSLHWMVRAGLGIAPCSLLLAATLGPGLVAKRLRPSPPRLGIHLIWRGSAPPPAGARWLKLLRPTAA